MDIKISTYIVDDEPDAVWKLDYLLKKHSFLGPINGETDSIRSVNYILSNLPDLIFLDIVMPGLDGFELLEKISRKFYNPVIVFTTAFDEYAIAAIKKAAFDYLLKPVDEDELSNCIYRIKNKILQRRKSQSVLVNLTKREEDVIRFLLKGKTSLEIASILNLSKHTIDTHRRKILKKTKFKSTAQLLSKLNREKD